MAAKRQQKRSTKHREFESALKNINIIEQIDACDYFELFALVDFIRAIQYSWMGNPTKEKLARIQDMQDILPCLGTLIDFDIVFKRLESLDTFEHSDYGIHINEFFPELVIIYAVAIDRIKNLPQGITKAEYWLTIIAQKAMANADIEACIYLASREREDVLDIVDIKNSWYSAICFDIVYKFPGIKIPKNLLEQIQEKTINLAKLADLLKTNQSVCRFFDFQYQEDDLIDAAMFRAVEWLEITGFSPWLESLISQISLGPSSSRFADHQLIGWWLFHWCRSDLALRMADKHGLNAWLWTFINGSIEQDKPWRLFDKYQAKDYIALAGIILFVWNRIKPIAMKEDRLLQATDLLLQTQMRCGAWPVYMDDSEPDLLTTCVAIHGLALQQPKGWERVVSHAAEWIKQQQQLEGYWYIEGAPTAYLTVLVLDALVLASGGTGVTFKLDTTQSVEKNSINKTNLTTILFLAADPTDASRLRLDHELRDIQENLQSALHRDKFNLQQRMSVRPTDINKALLNVNPQIVHFSGHGSSDGDLWFEDELGKTHPIDSDTLSAVFEQFSNQIDCVILNACYSEKQAQAIAHHIPYVIGMNQAIGDRAAIAFAVGFYQALGADKTIEEAFKFGVTQIRLQNIQEHLKPVLIKKHS